MPNPNTTIMWTPTFERHVTGYGSTSKHQKAFGLHAQTMLTILGSIINMIGGTYTTI